MPFVEPISFLQALTASHVKSILPSHLTSEQLSQLPVWFRERARFSAMTGNAEHVQKIDDVINAILEPERVVRDEEGGPRKVTEGMNLVEGRVALKESLDLIGYEPSPELRGGIQDLSSDRRLNLIIETNTEMAKGYGNWIDGQDQNILDAYPAQELFRGQDRKEPREWPSRWAGAGGQFFPGPGDYPEGRMIALKNDPIWEQVNQFGQPYPPFDFNSGMDVRDIGRAEAVELGIIGLNDRVVSQDRGFNDDLEAGVEKLAPELRKQLVEDMGGLVRFVNGVLEMKNRFSNSHRQDKTQPTEAQKKAGNYKMKHLKVAGLDISIETPKGKIRRGMSASGKFWSVKMPVDYGYVKGSRGADFDKVDVYLGPNKKSPRVWVIDQFDVDDHEFDEHKVMLGFDSWDKASDAYRQSFNDDRGMQRIGGVTALSIDGLWYWLNAGQRKEPLDDVPIVRIKAA